MSEVRSQKTEEWGIEINFYVDILGYRPSPCHPSPLLKAKNNNLKQTLKQERIIQFFIPDGCFGPMTRKHFVIIRQRK